MAIKKQLTQEQKLEKQRKFNAELVKSGAYKWMEGRLVPIETVGYDEANSMIDRTIKNVNDKTCTSRK
jgi:hypothetical protein